MNSMATAHIEAPIHAKVDFGMVDFSVGVPRCNMALAFSTGPLE
jgi:hypothetical protein